MIKFKRVDGIAGDVVLYKDLEEGEPFTVASSDCLRTKTQQGHMWFLGGIVRNDSFSPDTEVILAEATMTWGPRKGGGK